MFACPTAYAKPQPDAALRQHATKILEKTPIIDGHNDLPWELRDKFGDKAPMVDLAGTDGTPITKLQTDIKRLRAGHVGGQFWSVWIPSTVTGADAVKLTLEQIDVARSLTRNNPSVFAEASTAADIERIQKSGRIASLIGIEGGHQMGDSIPALRQFYALGVRYMTLTHSSNNALADSATDNPKHRGLSEFGRAVILEMNRIGMLVDLSHVSPDTMRQAIALSKAPVIFSHSGARAIAEHPRNVPDDILKSLKDRDGVVMVNFYSGYVSNAYNRWDADRGAEIARFNAPPFGGLYIGQPERAAEALAAWDKAHPKPAVTVGDVADHLDHIVKVAGIDHVGIGSDFDGVDGETPVGLKSVADYPNLFAELIRRGWSDDMLAKLAGGNILRVMQGAEKVAATSR
jgi:membrane dipeptidase